jgi:hypothetical protein
MLAVDLLPVYTGIIGVAGGVVAAVISGVVAKSEGRATRVHERETLLWQSRADSYIQGLEYAGRLADWGWDTKEAVISADGLLSDLEQSRDDPFQTEGWYKARSGLRAFGSDVLLAYFLELDNTRLAMDALVFMNDEDHLSSEDILNSYGAMQTAYERVRDRIASELQARIVHGPQSRRVPRPSSESPAAPAAGRASPGRRGPSTTEG